MANGTVKWFDAQKGYGFIQPVDGGRDILVYIRSVKRVGLNSLEEGQRVAYEIGSKKGVESAVNLKVS